LNLYPPLKFDGNEWFCLIMLLFGIVTTFLLPQRFPTIVTVSFFAIGLGIAMYADFHLGIPPRDLYKISDIDQYEWADFILFMIYTPFAYFFAYFLDKWKLSGLYISLYVLSWAIAGTALEGLAVYFHVYQYKGWQLAYSFFFYFAAQIVTLYFYHVVKKIYQQTKQDSGRNWT